MKVLLVPHVGSIPPLSNRIVIKFLSHKKWTELPAIDIKKITPNRTFENLVMEVRAIRRAIRIMVLRYFINTQSREDRILLRRSHCCAETVIA